MNILTRNSQLLFRWSSLRAIALFLCVFMAMPSYTQDMSDYSAVPPLISDSTPPMVMLAMSNDHQLFYKAFTDYEDVNEDGVIDLTYDNDIQYAGYFDSYKCYVYDSSQGRYEPVAITANHYCNNASSNQWSGNFLNWATMTRIDQVRLILYGGYRSTDTATETVLERSHLPNDAHSFAKYYNGLDLGLLTPFNSVTTGVPNTQSSGITICNTTYHPGSRRSQFVTDPPLARVARGNFSLWNAHERFQCLYHSSEGEHNNGSANTNYNNPSITGIQASSSLPRYSDRLGDFNVRVVVCETGLLGGESCKQYPDGNYKPVGLLQDYGEEADALFGLMTGTYNKSKSGGVLRKNIGDLSDEINTDTNGTFRGAPSSGGIIAAIDSLRIVNYNFNNGNTGTYNDGAGDNCRWGWNSFSNGQCRNWGNPLAEIMLECYRYFAGASPNSRFNTDDSGFFSDLTTQSWNNPQTADEPCSVLNVIAFNTNSISYDDASELDGSPGVADLDSTDNTEALTNRVGSGEGIHNNYWFVGNNGALNDQLCTAKYVTSLGKVEGSCPDAPRLEGSYRVAGLAHHARITDLRSDLEGDQVVNTFGVTLSAGVPRVNILVPGTTDEYVSILPACHNRSVRGNCGLVDFKIVEQTRTGTTASGSFYVNWEDSEQGGDYDQDMAGVLWYELTNSELRITTDVFAESTGDRMGFGYVVSGTEDDGFHVHSGIEGYSEYDCNNCQVGNAPNTKIYEVGESTAKLLEQPLFYAAKWGGFTDSNNNDEPDVEAEWDSDGDGLPDNFVFAINPLKLKAQLEHVLDRITERTASGTAAAVNAQTGSGEGAIYQALYAPLINGTNESQVRWVGYLHGLFVDNRGRVREDTDGDGQLDADDYLVEFAYDHDARKTFIYTYQVDGDGDAIEPAEAIFEMTSGVLNPIWDAPTELANVSNYLANRTNYSDLANTGRYIFTAFDRDGDGQVLAPVYSTVNSGQSSTNDGAHAFEAFNFALTGTTANDYRFLGFDSSATQTDVDNLVNFIRGEEGIAGARTRTLDGQKYLLGDIVNSTPASVAKPAARYDLRYRDDSYRDFYEQYKNRRSVVYVGANDGMLHAFNAGFFDANRVAFDESLNGATAHDLGDELWAYVPYNLLPHLQWLQDPNYSHVYYVDGPVRAYDVNIFADDATHPNGWGTIIVASMRFGGGDFSFDHDDDPSTPDLTTRSSYIIMDVTDPEQPPTLLAEITDEDLGFTLSEPVVVKTRKPNNSTGSYDTPSENGWYLLFGSGPAGGNEATRRFALDNAVSFKSAKSYVFDLQSQTLTQTDLGDPLSFTGGYTSIDWDEDYDDDAAYFGIVGRDSSGNRRGKLRRAKLDWTSGTLNSSHYTFFEPTGADVDQVFSAKPRAHRDATGDRWVFVGTGRYLTADDNLETNQESYYGIKEPASNSLTETVSIDDIVDTTHIDVYDDGRVFDSGAAATLRTSSATASVEEFDDVVAFIGEHGGWKFDFEWPLPDVLNTSVRNTTQAALAGNSLVISAYEATLLKCDTAGDALLYTPHLAAGVPAPFAPLGTDASDTIAPRVTGDPDPERVLMGAFVGVGSSSDPVVTRPSGDGEPDPEDRCADYRVSVQTGSGEISPTDLNCESFPDGRQSWREIPVNW